MIVRYKPRQLFQGLMYTENHRDECGVSGTNYGPTFLTLGIGNEMTEKRCGINRAFDYESLNRTLIYTHIIIQNNPLVMMQSDRYIKVGCISKFNRFGSDNMPNIVSFETSMEFNRNNHIDSNAFIIDTGGDVPKVKVLIIDSIDKKPVQEARIGQELQFLILMESYYDRYDLNPFHLTVTSETDELVLISFGCSAKTAIFPAFQKEITPNSKQLSTTFKAFKFASSAQIKFRVSVQFCLKACRPVVCKDGTVSHDRKTRESEFKTSKIVNNSVQSKIPQNLSRIIFPDEAAPPPVIDAVKFPAPTKQKVVDISTEENNNNIIVPLEFTLNFFEALPNETANRFIFAENEQPVGAGLGEKFCVQI